MVESIPPYCQKVFVRTLNIDTAPVTEDGLLPKEYEFFDMFDELAAHCVKASKQFQENMYIECEEIYDEYE